MSESIDLSHEGEDGNHHHVTINQDAVDAFVARKHFKCSECRKRYSMDDLSGLMVQGDSKLHGICTACEQRFKQMEAAGLN